MAWLGEGLSSLKGQISNFTKEVLSEVTEAREDGCGHESELLEAKEKIQHLESLCSAKDLEISKLREKNAAFERAKQFQPKKQQSLLYHVGSSPNLGGNFPFGDPDIVRREVTFDFSSMEAEKDDLVDYLRAEIRALKIEKEKVEKKMEIFQKKCSCLEIYPESTDKCSPRSVSYGMEKSDMVYPKGQKADDVVDGTEADLPASFQENKVPHSDGQDFDGDSGVNNHLLEKQPPIHLNHIKHLNSSEPQLNSKRRSFDGSLKCSLDVPGIEADGEKLMDARGECDGSEEIPKDVVKLMDQISKLTISLSDAQLNVNQLQENEKKILREMERIKDEEVKAKEKVRSLSTELETIHQYNHQLVQKLDEADKKNSAATEELMAVVSSVKCENEVLQSELKGIETKSHLLECELQTCLANSKTMHRDIELELEKEILKFIPPELIPREPRSNGCGGEVSVVVGAVKGLAKALEEQRWKRDALERKLSEMMKEAREVKAECVLLRGEIARRESSSALRATEGLAPILETGEEEDDEDEDVTDSRGSQTNTEEGVCVEGGICDKSEPNWQARCLALEEEVKRLISERTSWCKDSDVCDLDDDDADGIEEVNDWTWQAAKGEKTPEFKSVTLGGNVFVEDGEHAIMTISNDVGVLSQLASVANSGPTNCDAETLTDECAVGNLELRSEIEKLVEQKDVLERALGEAREATVQMEGKVLALSVEVEAKTRSEMELLEKENELKSKLSQHEAKIDSLENLLSAKSASVGKLETEIASLTSSLLNEKSCNEEMKKQAMDLRLQVAKLENQLKNNEDSLAGNADLVTALEDKCRILEQKVEEEAKMKDDSLNLVTCLEGRVASLQAHLEQEHKLAEDALRQVEGVEKENEGLKGKMAQEAKLKEEALSKLKDADSRFHVFEQSVHQEIQSKNELSDMIVELQRSLAVAKEVAKVERGQKEEAMVRVSEQDVLLKKLDEEMSVARMKLQEKEACISGHLERIQALEMERESIMCVVNDKAREISSLRSERQRLMEAMSSMEKMRRGDIAVVGDAHLGPSVDSLRSSGKDGLEGTSTPPGEKEPVDLDDDGTVQLLAKLSNLQLESEQLAESYRQEQQRNKHLQNEVHELLEKETALQEELQRLRLHLVAVEDRYTKEAVSAEDHIAFLKNKLTQVEERLHASSSAYTSASVRSNQQVESLENQIRALTEKRDESKSKLKAAEELLAQQAKDLTNLQTVLEQFQKDKDREISIVKDKMRVEVSSMEKRCHELSEEILSLKEQLHQAQEGLSAAARLSEQADKKSEIISSLRTELKKLNAGLIAAEEKLQSASLSVEGKVDKNLVKNLLLGYLSSPVQGSRRNEILRIIATILEFSPDEKAKADLTDGPGKGSSWLRGWGGGHLRDGNTASGLSQPSLSEAFIRFLESESRPKSVPQLHMIPEARTEQTRSSSPALGHSRTSSTSSSPPLLLPESILPTLPTFPVASGSSSSCILKDVLKDS